MEAFSSSSSGKSSSSLIANNKHSQQRPNSSSGRFGIKSHNMFFIRHTAKPKHLRLINGVGGVQVCSMKEDRFSLQDYLVKKINETNDFEAKSNYINQLNSLKPFNLLTNKAFGDNYNNKNKIIENDHQTTKMLTSLLKDSKYEIDFKNDDFNNKLLGLYRNQIIAKVRKEQFVPPIRFWTKSFMICDDTSKWRSELNRLGQQIGLLTDDELKLRAKIVLDTKKDDKIVFPNTSCNNRSSCSSRQKTSTQAKQTSASSRLITASLSHSCHNMRTSGSTSSKNFLRVDENEREIWLVQILSQILDTESMQDIQSWLVSADSYEKEAMKNLIKKAIQGLELSDRNNQDFYIMHDNDKQTQVDFETITNAYKTLVEKCEKNFKEIVKERTNNINSNKNNTKSTSSFNNSEQLNHLTIS